MKSDFPSTFNFHTWGTPGKETIVFVHANSFCAAMYEHVFEPFLDDYQILAFDIPGCGLAQWDSVIRNWHDIADYLLAFLKSQNIQTPVYAIGHSVGAISIILAADKHPALFKKLVLWEPVVLPRIRTLVFQFFIWIGKENVMPLIKAARKRRTSFSSRSAAIAHYKHKYIFNQLTPQSLEAYVDTCFIHSDEGHLTMRCSPTLEASIYQSIPVNIWKNIRRLQVETVIIAGHLSDTVTLKVIEKLSQINKQVQTKMTDGGHLFPFEDENTTAKMTLDALHDY